MPSPNVTSFSLSHVGILNGTTAAEVADLYGVNEGSLDVESDSYERQGDDKILSTTRWLTKGTVSFRTNYLPLDMMALLYGTPAVSSATENLNNLEFQALIDSIEDATDSIIAPLVEKYGDKSNGGMVTYRKVYKKMGEMSPINWHNLEVRYINKHGKAGARRKKIISSNPEMLRKFKNAVDVMMVG